jgi:Fibronectin type III domain
VSSLTNGTTYACKVHATNAGGDGPQSGAANVKVGVPSAPSRITASKGSPKGSIAVSFGAAAANGGTVTAYVATCVSGASTKSQKVAGNVRNATVKGLTRTKTYTCTVKATNKYGTGAGSAPSSPLKPR